MKRKCLIIDDDPDDQEIFVMCARKVNKDIDCVAVDDCVEAIVMLRSDSNYTPDFIFLDVNMPKMNGIDCLKELKRIGRLEKTKIFMYSTTSEEKVLSDSKKFGAHDYVVKPVKTAELKDKLYKIFNIVSEMNN
jgi:CheY-like chemotaxis protein